MPHDHDDNFQASEDGTQADDAKIEELARLSPMDYDRVRAEEAKNLGGLRLPTLDKLVAATRDRLQFEEMIARMEQMAVEEGEALTWSEPVDGDTLLDALVEAFHQYIVMKTAGLQLLALWTVHTYCFQRFQYTPRLHITSPKRRSGKSRVLDVLYCLVARALRADGLTAAVAFRLAEAQEPTMLIDECDQWLDTKGELIGILNSGHAKGQKVYRCVGDDNQVQGFNVFTPLALASIGEIKSDTLRDRTIAITVLRRLKTEPIKRFRRDQVEPEFEPLRQQAYRWVADTSFGDPEIPDAIDHDRLIDNWVPLLAIADAAGGEWPERAREIMLQQFWAYDAVEDGGWDTLLLQDLKAIFDERREEGIHTQVILGRLHGIEERPWSEYPNKRTGERKPISANQLSGLLKNFQIHPHQLKIDGRNRNGYKRSDFTEAWNRYLTPLSPLDPPETSSTPLPPAENKGSTGSTSANADSLPENTRETAEGREVEEMWTPYRGGRGHIRAR